jgi:hypothetical protein
MDCWYYRDMIDDKMEVGHKEGNWMVANYHYNQDTFDCKALAFVDIVDTFEAVLGWFVGWLWYDGRVVETMAVPKKREFLDK